MNELKVGLLAMLALVSLAIVSLRITANKANFGKFIEYRTILNDATGVYENSSIKVAGIVAGRIKKIELSGSQALVIFETMEQIKITKFSRLRIKSVGFLGDKYIDIYLGNPSAPRLKPKSLIQAELGAGFEQLGKDASSVLKDVKHISAAIRDALRTEDNKNAAKEVMGSIIEFSKNANELISGLNRVVKSNEQKIDQALKNIAQITEQLAYETDRNQDDSFMNNLGDVGPMMEGLNMAVADLQSIIADVKAGRGTVGKLLRDEEVIDQVNQTLSGVNKIVGRVNKYKTDVMIYTGGNNNQGSKTEVELDLIPGPERFFKLGAVVGDGTTISRETTTTTTVDDGTPQITSETEVDSSAYRFNMQIGRKINYLAVRVGLFESTGGVGFDYFSRNNNWITSFEAYDYRDDIGMNLKLSSQLRLWNIMYSKVTAEDLGRTSDHHVYTVSAGLRFTDEDLASLIGFAL